MKLFDFLRTRISQKGEVKVEDSEEDKIRKKLLTKNYNRAYLFCGEREKTDIINGNEITYLHSECFVADSQYPDSETRFVRLTGNNVDGAILNVNKKEYYSVGKYSGTILFIADNGIEYKVNSSISLDESWLSDHYMSGYEVVSRINEYNSIAINQKLKRIKEQKDIDSIFEK